MTSKGRAPRPGSGAARPDHLGPLVFASAVAAMGGFLSGYDSAVINGAVVAIRSHYAIGSVTLAHVMAIALIGAAAGAVVAGRLADRVGRVRCMQIAAAVFTVSVIGSALPFSLWELAFWRIVGGFAIGMALVSGAAYIAEVAPSAYRGRLGSFQPAAAVVGFAVSQLVNWGLLKAVGGNQRGRLLGLEAWQVMLVVTIVPTAVYGLLTFAIPESPRFLLSVGRRDRAREILAMVEGKNVDLDARVAEIEAAMKHEYGSTFKDLLGGAFLLKPIVWTGIGLAVLQQFVGITPSFYYCSLLWQSVGVCAEEAFFYSFLISIANILGVVIAMFFVDRIGRKPLTTIGSVGMVVGLALKAWTFSHPLVGGMLPAPHGLIGLIAAHAFVFFFSLSWGPVVWVLLSEMFPDNIRAAALGTALCIHWLAAWVVTSSFPTLAEWDLSMTYVIYAIFAAFSLLFVLKFVKETKGKTLEEMT
ncbi:sugar porter family MFS transporter [Streptomyces sp. RY43-2]|uniref:Sugar porter family MFS transporter n=1 Tax=Streptomyces macrolidinus TaxID=2952607 RepID=A0ABT0ZK73_9ACTN|nr:sugar porter family MFS transporter [Streptomyces macrolidinus]MCN9243980.1 sugar porter family MFS transporter [Streptomyces macrolidinus]